MGRSTRLRPSRCFRDERELVSQVFYRQDATGLYELDAIRDPAARAGPAPMHDALAARIASHAAVKDREFLRRALANVEAKLARIDGLLHTAPLPATGPQGQPEIRRLAYPLAVGREWILRADPLFTERVEAREGVVVGGRRLAAWRIRIESELFGPDDRVWLWFSHEGELRFRYHVQGVATDTEGNVVGTIVSDQDQSLVQYELAGRGSIATTPFGTRTRLHEGFASTR